ncbi:MAG: alpha-amylase [Pseudobacteriovorax sp.]|nr:alpha-amylase [Pseudobacteriovorax sp.]
MKLIFFLLMATLSLGFGCSLEEAKTPVTPPAEQPKDSGDQDDGPKDGAPDALPEPLDPLLPVEPVDPNDPEDPIKPDITLDIDTIIDTKGLAGTDVIVHMFNYTFEEIEASLPQLANAGFGAIQISPPQLSNGDPWWGRYQPVDYRIIDGPLGNEEQLKRMIAKAASFGMIVIADVVLNHMANLGRDHDLSFPPREIRNRYQIGGLFQHFDFKPAYCINNWQDPEHVRNGRLCSSADDSGLPDLRLDTDHVLNVHQTYLRKLKGLGIKGFRVDAVKHMEKEYFGRLFTDDIRQGMFIYGEVIATAYDFDRDLKQYLEATRMSFMDFPLQHTIQQAFGPGGKLVNLVGAENWNGALPWDRAITFVVNHDIPNNEGFRSKILDPKDEDLAYTYILGRSAGVPHIYTDKGRADGLWEDRWKGAHKDGQLRRKNFFHNIVHGSGEYILKSTDCTLIIRRGEEAFFTINKCGFDVTIEVELGVLSGDYREILKDVTFPINGDKQALYIPARSSQMFLHSTTIQ